MAENDQHDDQHDDVDTDGKPAHDEAATAIDDTSDGSATDDRDWKAEAEKWKSLSRKNEKAATTTAAKLKQFEDANKSEAERLQEAAASHQTRAERAESALKRREVAEQRAPEHATVAQIKAVAKRVTGESDEDLESDADELFALLAPEPPRKPVAGKPRERLRGGGDPDDEPEESDPRKLAALIHGRR